MPPGAPPWDRHILVVDDDPNLCLLLTYALESEGFRVDVAANGMQALDKVRDATPDAVILDLTMPIMGGDDFLYAWRAEVETRGVPVIAISEAFTGLRATDLGIAAFFPKPFDLGVLVRHVKDLLAFAPASSAAPDPRHPTSELREVVGDLGNVMSSVLGSVELLADASFAPDDRQAVAATALASAQRASALVRRLSHLVGALE